MLKITYVSCGCNQLSHTADWGYNNLLCYASNHAVVVYDPNIKSFGSTISTSYGHCDRINVIRWIKYAQPIPETELISASSDGTAIIWDSTNIFEGTLSISNVIKGHFSINLCDATYLTTNPLNLLIATFASNGQLSVWLRENNNNEIKLKQTISFSKKLAIEIKLAHLPKQNVDSVIPLLIVAMEDCTVSLYCANYNICKFVNKRKLELFELLIVLKGHSEWVTCIDTIAVGSEALLIASGSQDKTIHVWKVLIEKSKEIKSFSNLLNIKVKKNYFFKNSQKYAVFLENILRGHDSWVNGVHWRPAFTKTFDAIQSIQLLTCSSDKTAIIWEKKNDSDNWYDITRIGDLNENSSGFCGCTWNSNGKKILTYDYHGSFHMWEYQKSLNIWDPQPAPGGHFRSVVDLCWEPNGRFLLSTSIDQTTRIHAPWKNKNCQESWHQISRPQIHGYNLSTIAVLGSSRFASGAEEKVVRIFEAPDIFKKYLNKITDNVDDIKVNSASKVLLPVLGLTNKGLENNGVLHSVDGSYLELKSHYCKNYNQPPVEGILLEDTLWPEIQKLYGHGFEIQALASTHDGSLLASSAKSSTPEYAVIILWNTKSWTQKQQLFAHSLTVTQLAFSPNDKFLLSVSRDRTWSIFGIQGDKFKLNYSSQNNNVHKRIIWCCAWTHNSEYFATGSRDGNLCIWKNNKVEIQTCLPILKISEKNTPITAVTFAPFFCDKNVYIFAVGYSNGVINIKKFLQEENQKKYDSQNILHLDQSIAHHQAVRKLAFRPSQKRNSDRENILQLASCGDDTILKIFDINFREK